MAAPDDDQPRPVIPVLTYAPDRTRTSPLTTASLFVLEWFRVVLDVWTAIAFIAALSMLSTGRGWRVSTRELLVIFAALLGPVASWGLKRLIKRIR